MQPAPIFWQFDCRASKRNFGVVVDTGNNVRISRPAGWKAGVSPRSVCHREVLDLRARDLILDVPVDRRSCNPDYLKSQISRKPATFLGFGGGAARAVEHRDRSMRQHEPLFKSRLAPYAT
jgi:hypothetical protein